MTSPDKQQHADNMDRVLIRPNTCFTSVVKKSSVGHVPHEPSKGAVIAVPGSASTAAHGGQRILTITVLDSKQKHSTHIEHEAVVSPVVRKDFAQPSSLTSRQRVSSSNNIIAKSTAQADYRVERQADSKQPMHIERDAVNLPVFQKDIKQQSSLSSHHQVTDSNDIATRSTLPGDYKAERPSVYSSHIDQQMLLHESSGSVASASNAVSDKFDSGLFSGTSAFSNCTDAIADKRLPEASTSDGVQTLESEVVSLKEQLVIQSKVCQCQQHVASHVDNS